MCHELVPSAVTVGEIRSNSGHLAEVAKLASKGTHPKKVLDHSMVRSQILGPDKLSVNVVIDLLHEGPGGVLTVQVYMQCPVTVHIERERSHR